MGKGFKAICERMQKVREKTDAKAFCLSWNKFVAQLENLPFKFNLFGTTTWNFWPVCYLTA